MSTRSKPADAPISPPIKRWPADKVERWPVARLTPSAKNARTHSSEQVAQLASAIRRWGWTQPILVDEVGEIIAGHGRVLAAQLLGLSDVPVMVAEGWTEAERRSYAIADNKLALNAGWDEDMLVAELKAIEGLGFDIDLMGFSADEMAALFADKAGGKTDPDDVPPAPETPVSRPGDLWLLSGHRLVCGSSTDPATVTRVLAGERPHLMVTDPPYGVSYDPSWRATEGLNKHTAAQGKVMNDDQADWTEVWRLFPGDVAYVWHGGLHAGVVQQSLADAGLVARAQIIWNKTSLVIGRGDYHWKHEPCWYVVRKGKTGHWSGDRKQSTVWDIEHRRSETGHGTQKPVECMRRPMETNSKPGDRVFEPFNGSGTTIIAGQMTGRLVHAVELNPAYVDVAVTRWQGFTGQEATLEGDGRTFAEVAKERADG